jgi:hypothetical protein
MADVINTTTTFGALFSTMTSQVTGDPILTWFLVFMIFAAAMVGLGLSLEIIIIFSFPLFLIGAIASGVGIISTVLYMAIFYITIYLVNRFFLNG